MVKFDNSFITLAEEISDFIGQPVLFTQITHTGYNPDTLTYNSSTSQTYTVQAIILQMTRYGFEMMEKVGLPITQTMKEVWVPVGPYTPAVGDTCTDTGVTYRVQNIQEYKTQGRIAAYLLFVGV